MQSPDPKPSDEGEAKAKPKKKKRQKLHVERSGKIPRDLKPLIEKGKTHFSFPDDVWKVRDPRKRRRRKKA